MHNEFFRALCLPKCWGVCGVSVRALSCWHLYALEQLGNAYAFDGEGATRDDAAAMLMLCQSDWKTGSRLMWDTKAASKAMARIYRATRKTPFDDLHNACLDYSNSCRELPEVWHQQAKGGGKFMGGNHVWHVVVWLMSTGLTEAQAWDMPYTRARCYFDVSREASGGCEIMSDRQRALLHQAEAIKNGGAE